MPQAQEAQLAGARALQRSADLPLWAQLLADLRRRLQAGEFESWFPGELALVEQYAVSRHTVREALRHLRAEGVVTAARGRRPRLAKPVAIAQPVGVLYSLFAAVEAAGLEQTSVVRTLDIRSDALVAVRLGQEESCPLVYLERVRLADRVPLALDRVWLPASVAGSLLEADFSHTSLYAELAQRTGLHLTWGQETIRAVVPRPAERATLSLPAHAAALSIDRLGCADGAPVEWRRTLVRGDRFMLTAEATARTGYRLDVAGRALALDGSAPWRGWTTPPVG